MSKSGAARSTIRVRKSLGVHPEEGRAICNKNRVTRGRMEERYEALLSIRCTHVLSDVRDENFAYLFATGR